jgi:hypothetical protein
MTKTCIACRRTEDQIIADAKALGLLEELQSGLCTCCQISQWADEQCQAWFEATQLDGGRDDLTGKAAVIEAETVFVPVRHRPVQVPWYKDPDGSA